MGEAHQRLDDARDALGLLEDLPADLLQLAVALALLAQVLRQAGDAGDGVADLVGDTGGQAADGSEALGMHQLVFQQLGVGHVFHQQHQAAAAGGQGFFDRCLVQVKCTDLAIQRQALFVQVLVGQVDEAFQQALPGFGDGGQARSHDALGGNLGQFLHGAVPHEDFLVLGQGADAHRQFLQRLSMVAAQGVQFGRQACEARVVVLQSAFDEVDVFGDVALAAGFVGQEGFHHVLGHAGAHQAGEVGLDAVAQAAQGVGAAFVEGQVEVAQGLFHFLLCGLGAQGLGQLSGELLGRAGQQFAALRSAHVVHGAGFGGAAFFRAGFGEERNQGEDQHVGREGSDGRDVPAGVVEYVDGIEQRQVDALQVAHQGQQHGEQPDDEARQQAGDEAAAVGGRPVEH
ncbi:hypothetical protein D9M69_352860 [compost metagenome]